MRRSAAPMGHIGAPGSAGQPHPLRLRTSRASQRDNCNRTVWFLWIDHQRLRWETVQKLRKDCRQRSQRDGESVWIRSEDQSRHLSVQRKRRQDMDLRRSRAGTSEEHDAISCRILAYAYAESISYARWPIWVSAYLYLLHYIRELICNVLSLYHRRRNFGQKQTMSVLLMRFFRKGRFMNVIYCILQCNYNYNRRHKLLSKLQLTPH